MKKLIIALLIALALMPATKVFAQAGPGLLPPGFNEEGSGVRLPNGITPELTWLEFFLLAPTAKTPSLDLNFLLAVNNFTATAQQISIFTRTFSGSTFQRTDNYQPRQTRFFTAADVSCPTSGSGDVCALTLSAPEPGPTCFVVFDSLLIVLDNARGGEIVAILPPSFPQCQ